ncbi:unnamed protein product [Clonostachys rosea]|uniref:Uncharacterized protein n=1 Tax=Bionectria ochroleuca TaxID=29856 RepID=A0ABY6U3E0_BIOOC|nr:unnamed protein product [Clonostachys rosea]
MATLLKGAAFITGAASGIGRHTAIAFARHGVKRLAMADIDKGLLTTTYQDVKKMFPNVEVVPIQMDVRDQEQVRRGIAETVSAFGRLDIAVNNAGIGGSGKLTHEAEYEDIERVLDVNLHGVYRCQKEELAVMIKQEDHGPREGRGSIINVTSIYGLVAPNPWIAQTAYTAAKHGKYPFIYDLFYLASTYLQILYIGVIGLTKGDANAYSQYNIRINAIAPGYIGTPLDASSVDTTNPYAPLIQDLGRTPLQRIGLQEECADAIVLMASPMNSYMQGAVQVVDGGFTSN